MSPGVTLRRAVPSDVDQLAELLHAARLHSQPAIPPATHSQDEMRVWFAAVVMPEREVWVAEPATGDGLVALMVLDGGWLDQLYVAPGWLSLGIGGRLVALAKNRRPEGLQLWTFQSNSGARRFYEREGFTPVEETDGAGNEEKSRDVRYTWTPGVPDV